MREEVVKRYENLCVGDYVRFSVGDIKGESIDGCGTVLSVGETEIAIEIESAEKSLYVGFLNWQRGKYEEKVLNIKKEDLNDVCITPRKGEFPDVQGVIVKTNNGYVFWDVSDYDADTRMTIGIGTMSALNCATKNNWYPDKVVAVEEQTAFCIQPDKTDFQLLTELDTNMILVVDDEGKFSSETIALLDRALQLDRRDSLSLHNLRDTAVLFFSNKLITCGGEKVTEYKLLMQKKAVLVAIDKKLFGKGEK